MRKESTTIQKCNSRLTALGLNSDAAFHRSKLILKIYRDVVWVLSERAEELQETAWIMGEQDIESGLCYLENFAPDIELQAFEEKVCCLVQNQNFIKEAKAMQKQRVKTSMSVPEMGKMLGLGKVESYWLVKKNYFKTIQVAGRMRVMLDSFEDWYAGQFHYKKVDGTPPGEKWRHTTMSVPEMADLLGLKSGTAYDLVKRGYFETTLIDRRIRIITSSFEAWYQKQTHYVKISERSNENGIYREA